jgi:hypothetical protein
MQIMRLAAPDSGRRGGARRELAGELADDGQTGLPCTRLRGKKTKIKRRTWGTYKEAWRGARGAGRGDRRRAAELRRPSRGGGAARAGKGGGAAGVKRRPWGTFYR